MKVNKWTLGLAAVGLVSLPTLSQADEKLSPVQSAISSTILSGYVDTSIHWNPGTGNAYVPGIAYNTQAKQDGFNLNAVKVALEKPLDEGDWAAGYKAELLFGPNAAVLGTLGGSGQLAVKQAYVDVRIPVAKGLDVKVGVFDTIIGYESTDAGNNPNYTRSYGYTIEPTTHTGILGTYQLNDMLGFSAGIANSFGPTVGGTAVAPGTDRAWPTKAESYKTYMGSIAFKAPSGWSFLEGSTLYAGVINGFNGNVAAGAAADQTSWYVGGTIATPVKGLKLGASYDYAGVSKQPLTGDNSAYRNATALYASFQPEGSKFSFHARGEYFSQSHSLVSLQNAAVPKSAGFLPGKVFALTGTVQYDLWKNVLSRLEARWDHAADSTAGGGGNASYGGSDYTSTSGSKRNSYLVAANLIYKF